MCTYFMSILTYLIASFTAIVILDLDEPIFHDLETDSHLGVSSDLIVAHLLCGALPHGHSALS